VFLSTLLKILASYIAAVRILIRTLSHDLVFVHHWGNVASYISLNSLLDSRTRPEELYQARIMGIREQRECRLDDLFLFKTSWLHTTCKLIPPGSRCW
jgi:hypothetical protein